MRFCSLRKVLNCSIQKELGKFDEMMIINFLDDDDLQIDSRSPILFLKVLQWNVVKNC